MDPARVAELILIAAYHNLNTCWIAKQPVLLLGMALWPWPIRKTPMHCHAARSDHQLLHFILAAFRYTY